MKKEHVLCVCVLAAAFLFSYSEAIGYHVWRPGIRQGRRNLDRRLLASINVLFPFTLVKESLTRKRGRGEL